MKRSTFFGSALLAAWAFAPAVSADDSTSTDIYDQSPWSNEQVLKLFSTAWDDGRNYPTKAEFETIGLTMDLEFVRSHTRYRSIYKDETKDIVSDINHNRNLWCNLPGGYGKNIGGYPSSEFDQDVFSMWNYTNLFGSWNYGFLMAPGSWVDAAHKNGTRIYGGIKFFESWNNDGSEDAFNKFIQTKNEDGSYKYARAFVNAAAFFGNDGYNYNQEGTTYQTSDWINFHAAVMNVSRDLNIEGFGIGQYTTSSSLSTSNTNYLYGNATTGKIYDCMLNYSGNKLAYYMVSTSLSAAKSASGVGSVDGLYQGQLLVNLSTDYWTQMNTSTTKEMNICIWGEHDQSRFFQFRIGDNVLNTQANYQLLLEKAFSGANRNPLNRPAINNSWGSFQVATADLADTQLNNSPGFASMFPERTAIGGDLPFETHFSLGNGESYFYKGKVTHGTWYNMSQQDIVPTYRWLVTKVNDMTTYANDIDVRFTHEDAYIAGSSLKLSGATSTGNDIVLYRTQLTASAGNVKATLALKGAAGASNLSLIVKKSGSTSWIEVPCGDLAGTTWEEKELAISGISKGDVIEYIGLRVNGSTSSDWKMLVGKLKISDDRMVQQALIKKNSVVVEIKEETSKSLSVKIGWEPDYSAYSTSIDKFGMVYNDEINVDHYEVVYKEGVDGKVRELGRTAQWATYIGNIPMTQSTEAYIGVRSVSVDLKCVSPVEWVEIPHYEGTLPELEEEDPYGRTYLYNYGTSTLSSIVENIYWEKVVSTGATQNLNYNQTSNPAIGTEKESDNYYYAQDHVLKVEQGQTVTLTLKAHPQVGGDGLQYDFVYLYMDYDGNYSFLDADETLGSVGTLNAGTAAIASPGVSFTFTVPSDAKTGPTRLRIVGSDAWGAHPGPVGGTWKGYSLDFPVEITGSNPEREAAKTYKDYRDEGDPDEPEYIEEGLMGIERVGENATFSGVQLVGDVAYFTNTDKAWFYSVEGRCVKFVANAAEAASVADLAPGVYVVKMQNGQIIRSAKVVKK